MNVNERIARVARDSAGIRAGFVWKWAQENGWKPRNGETPDGRSEKTGAYLAWCAVTASYRVWLATRGAVVLCKGYKAGRRGVFAAGTDSVPVLLDWARDFGLLVARPTPGCIALIEVRGRDKDTGELAEWRGRPNHVGIVEDLGNGFALVREGNYAKRDALVTRYFEAGANAKEMVVAWVDVTKIAVAAAMDAVAMEAPEGDDTTADGIVELGDEDLRVATFVHERPRRARVTQVTEDGVFVQVIADDGQVEMAEPEMAPTEYVMMGRWEA